MEWILYIAGAIILIAFLAAIGFFAELISMIFMSLFAGVVSGGISALFNWGFSGGFNVGVIIGLVLYGIYCISRMFSGGYTITFYSDGSHEKDSESFHGFIGIIVMIVCIILWAKKYF